MMSNRAKALLVILWTAIFSVWLLLVYPRFFAASMPGGMGLGINISLAGVAASCITVAVLYATKPKVEKEGHKILKELKEAELEGRDGPLSPQPPTQEVPQIPQEVQTKDYGVVPVRIVEESVGFAHVVMTDFKQTSKRIVSAEIEKETK